MKLAQLNIAHAKFPLDAPQMKTFVDNLPRVNAIAESSPGFIWRLQDEGGDATGIQALDDPNMIVNLSVWQDLNALKNFMFRTVHRDFMRRKSEWFQRLPEATYVLWWIAPSHLPSLEEALARLEHLRTQGETPYAFSFQSNFEPPETAP